MHRAKDNSSPTVVLVHGAFADQSYWWATAQELRARGVPVLVRPNPLSGLAPDAEYTARAVRRIRGPVLLVGHSYGGAVISVAAAAADNVVGLVYLAGFILEEGETFGDGLAGFPETGSGSRSRGNARRRLAERPHAVPSSAADAGPSGSPADSAVALTEAGALTQPLAATIFHGRAPAAAWKQLPSWAVVATADRAIPAGAQRRMARRAGAETIEVPASHALAVSHSTVVVELILSALGTGSVERVAA